MWFYVVLCGFMWFMVIEVCSFLMLSYNFLFIISTADVGVAGKYQETNASLALQLCRLWLYQQKKYGKYL